MIIKKCTDLQKFNTFYGFYDWRGVLIAVVTKFARLIGFQNVRLDLN